MGTPQNTNTFVFKLKDASAEAKMGTREESSDVNITDYWVTQTCKRKRGGEKERKGDRQRAT